MKRRKVPLDLGEALVTFGKLRDNPLPNAKDAARLGQRLVREIQHLHKVLKYVRQGLPARYGDYIDPLRVETALARTQIESNEHQLTQELRPWLEAGVEQLRKLEE